MASISKDKNGTKRLVFNDNNGVRHFVRLGAVNVKQADLVKSRVEAIVSAKIMGVSFDAETSVWLRDIGDDLHDKLAKTGIIDARHTKTLAVFLESYKNERVDAKPNTVKAWNTSIKRLVQFFGDVPLRNVTHEKAAMYRVHLVQDDFSEASISKMIGVARMFFGVAHRRKLIEDNPFRYVDRGSQVNKDREHYVTQNETDHLINACSNAKQRLIIALARYAGLRIPSELVGLRWSEVNWETGRFIVHSPKTERKGKDKRIVPIFEKLYPYLLDAAEAATEGEDRIFPEIHEMKSMGSWLHKLADRASIILWAKPFPAGAVTLFVPPFLMRLVS
jgi:site-specific recombinase XerD